MAKFQAYVFQGKRTATKAVEAVENSSEFVWIDDIAVISVGKLGFARVESSWAQSDSAVGASTGLGALTGAILGAMAGPGGALAGALGGGSMAAMFSTAFDVAISDPRLEDFADSMKKDTSAVVLVDDGPFGDEFSTAFDAYNGTLIQTDLDGKDIETIRKALQEK